MPTYSDPVHTDCCVDCPGAGGAALLPPFNCVRWCDDPQKLIDACFSALRQEGWKFQCSLRAAWKGQHALRIAENLLNYPIAPPPQIRTSLTAIAHIGSDYRTMLFHVACSSLRIGAVLEIVVF
jgi:hypothetical protein